MIGSFVRSPMGMAAILASALGGPYVLYETDAGKLTRNSASQLWQTTTGDAQQNLGLPGSLFGPSSSNSSAHGYLGPATAVPGSTAALWNYTTGTPSIAQLQQADPNKLVVGAPIHDLRAVLRFDITPGWIPQNFARVSTVLSETNMDGLRVPIVTGTAPTDLAGTLTYYFDRQHSLRRVTLHGLTGDPNGLAQIMMAYYQLTPEPSLGGHLYTIKWNNRVTSLMQIAPSPIIYATSQHSKYSVYIELNQPALEYGLSYESRELLNAGQQVRKW